MEMLTKASPFLTVLCAVMLVFSPIFSVAASPVESIPVDTFWQQVEQTLAWLGTAHNPAEWQVQAENWSQIQQIELPGGQLVPVDTSEIVRQLRAYQPDPEKLKTYLSTLVKSHEEWSQKDCGDCKIGLLNEILARPEFQTKNEQPNAILQFFQNLFSTIYRWLVNIIGGTELLVNILRVIFTIIVSILLVAILILAFRDIFRGMAQEAELAEEIPGESETLTAHLASQKAAQFSGVGDFRHAMRYLYLSALLLLSERGLLRYDRSLTNREYLRQVSSRSDLENNLKVVVDDFDRVWYGYQPVNKAEYDRYAENVSAIKEIKE